jgi:hypothetical protein
VSYILPKTKTAGADPSAEPLSKQTLVGIGVNGFYYQQVTADSGSGARLGPNQGTDIGVGPVVTLIHRQRSTISRSRQNGLLEIDTTHRLAGDWVWVVAIREEPLG